MTSISKLSGLLSNIEDAFLAESNRWLCDYVQMYWRSLRGLDSILSKNSPPKEVSASDILHIVHRLKSATLSRLQSSLDLAFRDPRSNQSHYCYRVILFEPHRGKSTSTKHITLGKSYQPRDPWGLFPTYAYPVDAGCSLKMRDGTVRGFPITGLTNGCGLVVKVFQGDGGLLANDPTQLDYWCDLTEEHQSRSFYAFPLYSLPQFDTVELRFGSVCIDTKHDATWEALDINSRSMHRVLEPARHALLAAFNLEYLVSAWFSPRVAPYRRQRFESNVNMEMSKNAT